MSRRRNIVFTGGLLALTLAAGWPVGAHYGAKWQVARYKRQLKEQGERLSVAELVPAARNPDENGAPALVAAVKRLGSVSSGNAVPAMRYVVPGRALLATAQPVLPTEVTADLWPGLRAMTEGRQEDLAELRAALEWPVLEFNLDYPQTGIQPLGHLTQLRAAAQWLSAAALLDLHEGRTTRALENVNALARLTARYPEEPLLVSGLARVAIGQTALNATWEALQSADLPEAPLAQLQATWESVDLTRQSEAALAMNRAGLERAFADSRQSYRELNARWGGLAASQGSGLDELAGAGRDLLSDPRLGLKKLAYRYPGYWAWRWWWSYEDELVSLQCLQAALDAARTERRTGMVGPALKEYNQAVTRIQNHHPAAGRWLESLALNEQMAGSFLVRVSELETERRLLIAALGLKRHQLRHGRYPEFLAELVPAFLRAVPLDAQDGQPLRYRLALPGTFVLYSVGTDGEDNGGDPSPTESGTIRRQYWRGKDVVWPQPASTEEFQIYVATLRNPLRRGAAAPRPIVTNGMPAFVLKEVQILSARFNLLPTNQSR